MLVQHLLECLLQWIPCSHLWSWYYKKEITPTELTRLVGLSFLGLGSTCDLALAETWSLPEASQPIDLFIDGAFPHLKRHTSNVGVTGMANPVIKSLKLLHYFFLSLSAWELFFGKFPMGFVALRWEWCRVLVRFIIYTFKPLSLLAFSLLLALMVIWWILVAWAILAVSGAWILHIFGEKVPWAKWTYWQSRICSSSSGSHNAIFGSILVSVFNYCDLGIKTFVLTSWSFIW